MDAGSAGELAVTKAQWDNILSGFGTNPGDSKKVYWTVSPGAGSAGTRVRSLTATRAIPQAFNRTGWTADATYGKASAANVLDGIHTSEWTVPVTEANTNSNPPPDPPVEIVLDMKSKARITTVAVSKSLGVAFVVIYLSEDGEHWGNALNNPPEGHTMPDMRAEWTWTTATPERAQYVKVWIASQYGGQDIGVREITVSGYDF
jgi:hypothetical protein